MLFTCQWLRSSPLIFINTKQGFFDCNSTWTRSRKVRSCIKKRLDTISGMICEFTHAMLKVCVKLAALSAERLGRRKTYGPGETRT